MSISEKIELLKVLVAIINSNVKPSLKEVAQNEMSVILENLN